MVDRDALSQAIAAQEALRGTVPDEVVDAAIEAMKSQLGSSRANVPQRRGQATVLFADVAGFTAMSEDLDAEVVATLMNELWRGVDRAIFSNGGHVDKHIGDAVLGVWGAAAAREDDPERAVRAGLELRTAFDTFRQDEGLDIDRLEAAIAQLPRTVYRVKGFVFAGQDPHHRHLLQAVGMRGDIEPFDPWGDRRPSTELVVIATSGQQDRPQVEALFDAGLSTL